MIFAISLGVLLGFVFLACGDIPVYEVDGVVFFSKRRAERYLNTLHEYAEIAQEIVEINREIERIMASIKAEGEQEE